jgi:hypothetical protein
VLRKHPVYPRAVTASTYLMLRTGRANQANTLVMESYEAAPAASHGQSLEFQSRSGQDISSLPKSSHGQGPSYAKGGSVHQDISGSTKDGYSSKSISHAKESKSKPRTHRRDVGHEGEVIEELEQPSESFQDISRFPPDSQSHSVSGTKQSKSKSRTKGNKSHSKSKSSSSLIRDVKESGSHERSYHGEGPLAITASKRTDEGGHSLKMSSGSHGSRPIASKHFSATGAVSQPATDSDGDPVDCVLKMIEEKETQIKEMHDSNRLEDQEKGANLEHLKIEVEALRNRLPKGFEKKSSTFTQYAENPR